MIQLCSCIYIFFYKFKILRKPFGSLCIFLATQLYCITDHLLNQSTLTRLLTQRYISVIVVKQVWLASTTTAANSRCNHGVLFNTVGQLGAAEQLWHTYTRADFGSM